MAATLAKSLLAARTLARGRSALARAGAPPACSLAPPQLQRRGLCSQQSGTFQPPEEERRIRELQQRMGELYRGAQYEEARDCAEECRRLATAAFGDAHPVTASASNNAALMLKALGERERATAMYRTSLAQYTAALGESHRSTATAACNLALLLRDIGGADGLAEAQAR